METLANETSDESKRGRVMLNGTENWLQGLVRRIISRNKKIPADFTSEDDAHRSAGNVGAIKGKVLFTVCSGSAQGEINRYNQHTQQPSLTYRPWPFVFLPKLVGEISIIS